MIEMSNSIVETLDAIEYFENENYMVLVVHLHSFLIGSTLKFQNFHSALTLVQQSESGIS